MAQLDQRRWYDRDPLLSMAMKILEESSDEEQIRMAMHVVKIINEHNIEVAIPIPDGATGDTPLSVDMLTKNARWYDFDKKLQTSIEALRCCHSETQILIAREIVQMLKDVLDVSENTDRV